MEDSELPKGEILLAVQVQGPGTHIARNGWTLESCPLTPQECCDT